MDIRHLVFLALVVSTSSINAQDSKPVPAYGNYMEGCVGQAEPRGGFGSSIDKAMTEAMCHCKFEHLPKKTMTRDQFMKAGYACKSEEERDSTAFTKKYYSKIKRGP